MGFKKVYRALQEIFPEVDSRALRAVAIEHSKDADIAVEVVLNEVIPFLEEKSTPSISSSEKSTIKPSSGYALDANGVILIDDEEDNTSNVGHDQSVALNEQKTETITDQLEVNEETVVSNETRDVEPELSDKSVGVSNETFDLETELTEKSPEPSDEANDKINAIFASFGKSDESSDLTTVLPEKSQESKEPETVPADTTDLTSSTLKESNEGDENSDVMNDVRATHEYVKEVNNNEDEDVQVASSSNQDNGELIALPDMIDFDSQYSIIDPSKKDDTLSDMVDFVNDFDLNTMVTRSGQICSVDLLEGIIEDAKSNKKTLFAAMESVMSLMREVELQEQATEDAEEAAAKGGLDILNRVDDLKKMLEHAKEANDMHAGEVYGERAILATEVRELQSRLLSLSDERDKSLAVLDEMHKSLVSRLEIAEKAMEVAEKDRLEKEESARKLLSEQELVMEKVVEEANNLKREAEENAKLQEFLVDRGRVVDMLQGEISVICEDVMLMKEKFDERVPFSKSLSSSQTSCILASSSSSLKSVTRDQVVEKVNDDNDESASSDNQKKSMDDHEDEEEEEQKISVGSTSVGDDRKALVEEGWEICDSGDEYNM